MHKTGADVTAHLATVVPEKRRRDALVLVELMSEVSGREPQMWSGGIVGFGSYHYRYPTRNEGDAPILGFAPRKASTTVYMSDGFAESAEQLELLGPHTTSVSCLYVKDVSAVDLDVLKGLVTQTYRRITEGSMDGAEITVTG